MYLNLKLVQKEITFVVHNYGNDDCNIINGNQYIETMVRKQVKWHYGDPNTFEMLNVELWLLSGQMLAFNNMNHYYTLSLTSY